MKKALPYREGSCFAVPLKRGGYAVGVVARMRPGGKVILAYLFGPKRKSVPTLVDVAGLHPENAIKRSHVGDLGLIEGTWPVIGELPGWDRTAWSSPAFVRRDELSKRAWRVIYSDADPNVVEREEPVSYDVDGMEKDGLGGRGFVEQVLTNLLDGERSVG